MYEIKKASPDLLKSVENESRRGGPGWRSLPFSDLEQGEFFELKPEDLKRWALIKVWAGRASKELERTFSAVKREGRLLIIRR